MFKRIIERFVKFLLEIFLNSPIDRINVEFFKNDFNIGGKE